MEHQNETTPLLANPHQYYIEDESTESHSGISEPSSQWRLVPDWSPVQWRVMIAGALLMLSLNFGNPDLRGYYLPKLRTVNQRDVIDVIGWYGS